MGNARRYASGIRARNGRRLGAEALGEQLAAVVGDGGRLTAFDRGRGLDEEVAQQHAPRRAPRGRPSRTRVADREEVEQPQPFRVARARGGEVVGDVASERSRRVAISAIRGGCARARRGSRGLRCRDRCAAPAATRSSAPTSEWSWPCLCRCRAAAREQQQLGAAAARATTRVEAPGGPAHRPRRGAPRRSRALPGGAGRR